jgi:hypothetical protein
MEPSEAIVPQSRQVLTRDIALLNNAHLHIACTTQDMLQGATLSFTEARPVITVKLGYNVIKGT